MHGVRIWRCRCHRWLWVATSTGAVAYEDTSAPNVLQRVGDALTAEIDHPAEPTDLLGRLMYRLDRVIGRLLRDPDWRLNL